jgi:CubicO group peptidase (beta-lactamase class C family)
MQRVSVATNTDATLQIATRFSPGFMVAMDNRDKRESDSVLIGDRAFGHVGAGGSLGFADPDVALSFGYTMNRLGAGTLLNERGQGLVDATYAAISALE